jgi:large subunit ribosomal protein L6
MSRLGKQPVEIPAGVEASFDAGVLSIKGPKGTLTLKVRPIISVAIENNTIVFARSKETIESRALWGTYAALAGNMIEGVTNGFKKVLEIEGVGYRADAQGQKLTLSVGF